MIDMHNESYMGRSHKERTKTIMYLRIDNGPEYFSNEFSEYCNLKVLKGIALYLRTLNKMGRRKG